MTTIDRHFVRLAEGQVHYRSAGPRGAPPLLMLHASPGGAALLEPLMSALAGQRRLIAPDTLGNGDSAPLAIQQPELPDYAGSMLRVLDTLGEGGVLEFADPSHRTGEKAGRIERFLTSK